MRESYLQKLINSRFGVGLALILGRRVPPSIGYPLASRIAGIIARQENSSLVKSVRLNQWIANGCSMSAEQLDQSVAATFDHTARCIYDLYHHIEQPEQMQARIRFSPRSLEILNHSQNTGQGMIIVGVHMSNFDLIAQAASRKGLNALVLSYAQPGKGYQWQNDLRKKSGLEIMPASKSSIRMAIERLQSGGQVLTGMDRPISGTVYRPRFFGLPASLPVHHILIALKAKVPVTVVGAIFNPDGIYEIFVSEPIYMEKGINRHVEIIHNAERVLNVGAAYIRQAPSQWAMFYPVWPDIEIHPA